MAEKNSRGKRKPAYQVRLERTLDLVTSERNAAVTKLDLVEQDRDDLVARLDEVKSDRNAVRKQVADLEHLLQRTKQEKSDEQIRAANALADFGEERVKLHAATAVIEKLLHVLELPAGPNRERVLLDALTQMRHLRPFV